MTGLACWVVLEAVLLESLSLLQPEIKLVITMAKISLAECGGKSDSMIVLKISAQNG